MSALCQKQTHALQLVICNSAPCRADALGAACNFELASHFQALVVKADDGKCIIDHALRQQGFAITTPGYALRPLPDFDFANLVEPGSLDAENYEQTVIVVKRMARRDTRAVLRDHSQKVAIV